MIKWILILVLLPILASAQLNLRGDTVTTLKFYDTTKVDAKILEKHPEVLVTDSSFQHSFWKSECYLRVDLSNGKNPLKGTEPTLSSLNDKPRVEIEANGLTHDLFAKDTNAFEWNIVLDSNPDTNVFTYQIETKGLLFYYQPDEPGMDDSAIGSYAVEHATQVHNRREVDGSYRAYNGGQVGNIWRPDAWNSKGDTVACSLWVDAGAGLLSVIVPQSIMDLTDQRKAWPLTVDPEFGYNNNGNANSGEFNGTVRGNAWTTAQATTPSDSTYDVDSLYFRGLGQAGSWTVWIAIYDVDGSNDPEDFVSQSRLDASGSSTAWFGIDVDIELAVSNTYTLVVGRSTAVGAVQYRKRAGSSGEMSVDQTTSVFNDPFQNDANLGDHMCVYAVYNAVAVGGDADISHVRRIKEGEGK